MSRYDEYDYEDYGTGRKNLILWIVCFALIAVIAIGLIVSFARINAAIPTKTVSTSAFEIGLLGTDDGEYVVGTTSIYTEDNIPVDGLKCKPTATASIEYQVFFYDEEDEFISATSVYSEDIWSTEFHEVPENAKFARVMITPLHDPEISGKEVRTYAEMLTITYNK